MKTNAFLMYLTLFLTVLSCSKNINYSPEHIKQTSGRYLFNENEVIDVYYEQNDLYVTWKGVSKKPVIFDENTFFVADLYKKLRFVKHPDTQKRYLGVVSENGDVTFEYIKVDATYKTPKMYLKDKAYDEAIAAYLELKKQDSTKIHIEEQEVNSIGYGLLRDKNYADAIAIFKMNTVLYPESDNVYDSLADAYLRSGDSTAAYSNYVKAYDLNPRNKRAKEFMDQYIEK